MGRRRIRKIRYEDKLGNVGSIGSGDKLLLQTVDAFIDEVSGDFEFVGRCNDVARCASSKTESVSHTYPMFI